MPQCSSAPGFFKRSLIFIHRWLGVILCLFFLVWFLSGIVMMYWGFPSVTAADRLARSPALDSSSLRVAPIDAASKAARETPGQIRLNTFDGRPVYRFRSGADEALVYADTGEQRTDVSKAAVDRIASAWTGQAASLARVAAVENVDQWTIQSRVRDLKPLWKYSWPDGQDVYVSQASGEVVQYTTTASRWAAHFGAIPHWLYFTPLRQHGRQWSQVVIWTSGLGTVSAALGIVIGLWMYSPTRRYRYAGAPRSIPYRGQKWWHMVLGLLFGVGAVTWAFSGMLSMDPFPVQRSGNPADGDGSGTAGDIRRALRGRFDVARFSGKSPAEALRQLGGVQVKELELTSFAGEPVYLATLAGGDTRIVPVRGEPRFEFDRQRIMDILKAATKASGGAEVRVLTQYDTYYLDRRRQQPLPVIVAQVYDAAHRRCYIDPKTARIVGTYSSRNWVNRWLYHGLHSLDFPWLYEHRPLWDVVVITFMLGGTALSVTGVMLAWRVIGRTLRRG